MSRAVSVWMVKSGVFLVAFTIVLMQALTVVWARLPWPLSGQVFVGVLAADLAVVGVGWAITARWHKLNRERLRAGSMDRYGMDTTRRNADGRGR